MTAKFMLVYGLTLPGFFFKNGTKKYQAQPWERKNYWRGGKGRCVDVKINNNIIIF